MRSRHRSRSLALTGLAAAALVAPADASAARGFKVPLPKAGEASVVRVELRAEPSRPGVAPVVRGMRVTNARRLPRRLFVAGRLTRVRRTNRYIARVVTLRKGVPENPARAAQDRPPFQPPFVSLFPHDSFNIVDVTGDNNVITDPDPEALCFAPQSDAEWSGFTRLVHANLVEQNAVDDLAQAVRDIFCARPVGGQFPSRFDTYDPIPFFTGLHQPFEGSRVEHVFRFHGNEDAGSVLLSPPPGLEFTLCGGDVPCFVMNGHICVFGPFPAGDDVDVQGRANGEIPRTRLDAEWFPPTGGVPCQTEPRKFYIGGRFRF